MLPLIVIAAVSLAALAALCACFLRIVLFARLFGQERVERYLKMRVQGPFVPVHEEKTSFEK